MPTWPATLPQVPLQSGYSREGQDQTLRTQMDAGPPKVRRRFTAGITTFTCSYRLTAAQKAALDAFFDGDAGGGALSFDWPHPEDGTAVSARFVGPAKVTGVHGLNYYVSATFEVLP